jgi:hypothetical protein
MDKVQNAVSSECTIPVWQTVHTDPVRPSIAIITCADYLLSSVCYCGNGGLTITNAQQLMYAPVLNQMAHVHCCICSPSTVCLGHYATSRKVAGSTPDYVTEYYQFT